MSYGLVSNSLGQGEQIVQKARASSPWSGFWGGPWDEESWSWHDEAEDEKADDEEVVDEEAEDEDAGIPLTLTDVEDV